MQSYQMMAVCINLLVGNKLQINTCILVLLTNVTFTSHELICIKAYLLKPIRESLIVLTRRVPV